MISELELATFKRLYILCWFVSQAVLHNKDFTFEFVYVHIASLEIFVCFLFYFINFNTITSRFYLKMSHALVSFKTVSGVQDTTVIEASDLAWL